ncbi:MAG TPA: Rieske (2Fe-2S) protein [Kribbella sp.]|nr:Rieske (2Fe-2S) protein [Kribbella sp.]
MSNDNLAELGRAIDTLRDRRAVLRGAAVAGLAGVGLPLLAACGDNGDSAGGSTSSSAPASGPTSAPTGSASSSAGGGGGSVLGPTADIPVGGGKIFPEAKIVVTQPASGQFKGFTAVCTHAGCIVSEVKDKTIECPCHGSRYNITDGSVVNGPAPAPLAAVAVTVKGGNVVGPAS